MLSRSSSACSVGSNTRRNSVCTSATAPMTPTNLARVTSITTIASAVSPDQLSRGSWRNFSHRTTQSTPLTSSEELVLTSSRAQVPSRPVSTTVDSLLIGDSFAGAEMSDIFSFGCVLLDTITFLLKGKKTEFVKWRTSSADTPRSSPNRSRSDASFHSNLDKIDSWIGALGQDSRRRSEPAFRSAPELLQLVQKMLLRAPSLRPTALQVRDRIQEIFAGLGGIETSCCANREWRTSHFQSTMVDDWTSYLARTDSVATDMITVPYESTCASPRPITQNEKLDALARMPSDPSSVRDRRRSSSALPVRKVSSWRRALSRAS